MPLRSSKDGVAPSWARRPAVVAAGVAVGALALVALAYLQADVPDPLTIGLSQVRDLVRGLGVWSSFLLLYLEESGVPLPVPGDVWVMYVGAHAGNRWLNWLAAEVGLVAVVVLGASNLYLLSRRIGPRIARGRLGRLLHLTPERLDRAERWFNRHGLLAIVFGRHVPGLRVPLTVAAGALKVPYLKFAGYVAVSSSIWAAVFLFIGIRFGPQVSHYLQLHRAAYWAFLAPLALLIGAGVWARVRQARSQSSARHIDGSAGQEILRIGEQSRLTPAVEEDQRPR